jgi:hypothetical protein
MRLELPTDFGLLVPVAMSLLSLRLFRLAWRSRRLPEALVGVYFLVVPVAISLAIRVDRFDASDAATVRATSNALFTLGGVALLLFAWVVFRADVAWAKALAWGGSIVLAALWALCGAAGAYRSGATGFAVLLPVFASYVWVFAESQHYYRLLRKRRKLGLVDPIVANRFLLFAIWTGAVVAITVLGVVGAIVQILAGAFQEGGGLSDPVILAATRILAIPIVVSLWLIFLAPARYHAWLRREASVSSAE